MTSEPIDWGPDTGKDSMWLAVTIRRVLRSKREELAEDLYGIPGGAWQLISEESRAAWRCRADRILALLGAKEEPKGGT